jgi:hypothetical protein
MDAQRQPLQDAVGPPVTEAFARVEGLLVELDEALVAEDVTQVRAVVGFIRAALAPLAPDLGFAVPSEEAADTVLRWRRAPDTILALAEAGRWRDMRNAAIELTGDITRRGPSVIGAAGEGSEHQVQVARVFAMRLWAAALDQSKSDADLSARFFLEAADSLLVDLGVLPTPAPTVDSASRLLLRVYTVESDVGEIATIPLVAEGIPHVGLGSYRLRVRWSPASLRLAGVTWDVGEGSLLRDDAAGTVDLALPPAPTGPSGDEVLARLEYEVLAPDYSVEGLLPANQIESLRESIALATDHISQADIPKAASVLTSAYTRYVDGAERPGSLFSLLAAFGLADQLAMRLLIAVDLASQPADVDVTVSAVSMVAQALESTLQQYRVNLGLIADLPVTLEVMELTDTRGDPLPVDRIVPGGVNLRGDPVDDSKPTLPADLLVHITQEPSGREPSDASQTSSEGGAPALALSLPGDVPFGLVAALLGASLLGVIAVWWAMSQSE